MGNNSGKSKGQESTLPTMTEDTVGELFGSNMSGSTGIPDSFDIDEHETFLNQLDYIIEDNKYTHHPDDFQGHEDDEQVNYEIYQQWVQAGDMLQASKTLLNQALEFEGMYGENNELAVNAYDHYIDATKQLINFINDIPENR